MAQRTFLHAADLHLDSPLLRLDLGADPVAAELVRGATRSAFVRLVDHALRRQVAFVVLAGDLWDGEWQDVHTGLWFLRQLGRLAAAAIPVVFVRGNHDAASEVTPLLRWPEHVHELATAAPETLRLEALRVALHGQGFAERHVTANLAAHYPPPVPGWLNVGVLHTALDGAADHAPYAPCTVADLAARGYDYWALGHVHAFGVRNEAPWIVYPGCLQGRHVNETGAKGAVEVDYAGDRVLAVRHVPLDVVRWARPTVDLTAATSRNDAEDRIVHRLRDLAAGVDPGVGLIVVRPRLRGGAPAAAALLADRRGAADRIAGLAAGLNPTVIVEDLDGGLDDPPPRPLHATSDLGDDAVADLAHRLDALARDETVAAELAAWVEQVRRRTPAEAQAQLETGPLAALFAGDTARILADRCGAAHSLLVDDPAETAPDAPRGP